MCLRGENQLLSTGIYSNHFHPQTHTNTHTHTQCSNAKKETFSTRIHVPEVSPTKSAITHTHTHSLTHIHTHTFVESLITWVKTEGIIESMWL